MALETREYAYSIEILDSDWHTFVWLSERGYDGDMYFLSDTIEQKDGFCVLSFEEPQAWDVNECISDNPDAFLTCCGSETLSKAMISLWQSIV